MGVSSSPKTKWKENSIEENPKKKHTEAAWERHGCEFQSQNKMKGKPYRRKANKHTEAACESHGCEFQSQWYKKQNLKNKRR